MAKKSDNCQLVQVDHAETFKQTREKIKSLMGAVTVRTLQCSSCATMVQNNGHQDMFAVECIRQGWKVSRGSPVCPGCAREQGIE